jgi:DNA-directed RNA polymerase subunit RPC12/RpoP
VPRITFRFGTK